MVNTMNRSVRHAVAALLIAVAALAGVVGHSEKQADAWAWDPRVSLIGKVTCSPAMGTTPSNVWVTGGNGEQGWAALSGSGITRSYRFDFRRVPTTTMGVRINWDCNGFGRASTTFPLNRPAWGNDATRNLCPPWWTTFCVII